MIVNVAQAGVMKINVKPRKHKDNHVKKKVEMILFAQQIIAVNTMMVIINVDRKTSLRLWVLYPIGVLIYQMENNVNMIVNVIQVGVGKIHVKNLNKLERHVMKKMVLILFVKTVNVVMKRMEVIFAVITQQHLSVQQVIGVLI